MLDVGITPVADWLCVVAGRINETKQFGAFIGLLPVSKHVMLHTDTRSSVGRMMYVAGSSPVGCLFV